MSVTDDAPLIPVRANDLDSRRASGDEGTGVGCLKILHANALTSPAAVDGVNSTIWSVAAEQALAGHDVGIVLGSPAPDAVRLAERYGMQLHVVGSSLQSYAADLSAVIKTHRIQVAHLHSSFAVWLAVASVVASRLGVCQVMTPHGALSPRAIERR